jgi:hypothetical protein
MVISGTHTENGFLSKVGPLTLLRASQGLTGKFNRPLVPRNQASNRTQERRFAAPGGANDGVDAPGIDLQINLAKGWLALVGDGQFLDHKAAT